MGGVLERILAAIFAGALLCSVSTVAVQAQTAPNDPRISDRDFTSNETSSNDAVSSLSSSALSCQFNNEEFSSLVSKGASAETSFQINGFNLTAIDGLAAEGKAVKRLNQRLEQYIGQSTDIGGLQAIAVQAQCALRADGNLLSAVIVPPQTLSRGGADVQLNIVMGFVSQIDYTYKGSRLSSDVELSGLKGAEKRAIQRVMTQFGALLDTSYEDDDALARAVLLASRIPGVSVRPTLKKADSGEVGAVNLSVDIFDFDAYRGDITLLNYSPEVLGRWGPLLQLSAHSQLLPGDRFNVSAYSSTDFSAQNVIRANYDVPLGGSDVVLGLYGSYGKSEPKNELSDIELETESLVFGGQISYPWKVNTDFQLDIYGGAEIVEQNLDVVGSRISNDKLSIGFAGIEGFVYKGKLFSFYDLEVRQGFSAFGASEEGEFDVSRIGANPQAMVVRANLDTRFNLARNIALKGRLSGQYSKDPLLAYEEFAVGNFTIGRGYEPGLLSGDSAVGGAFEILTGPFSLASAASDGGLDIKLSPYIFYDVVEVWNEDQFSEDNRNLASRGVGVRLDLTDNFSADITYADARKRVFAVSEEAPGDTFLVRTSFRF